MHIQTGIAHISFDPLTPKGFLQKSENIWYFDIFHPIVVIFETSFQGKEKPEKVTLRSILKAMRSTGACVEFGFFMNK